MSVSNEARTNGPVGTTPRPPPSFWSWLTTPSHPMPCECKPLIKDGSTPELKKSRELLHTSIGHPGSNDLPPFPHLYAVRRYRTLYQLQVHGLC